MNTLLFLLLFPLISAILLLVIPQDSLRKIIVNISAIALCVGSIYLFLTNISQQSTFFTFEHEWISQLLLVLEVGLALFIIVTGIRYKKYVVSLLMLIQSSLMIYFELAHGHQLHVEYNLFVDKFSVLMALIIGIIGSLICVYALGYMKSFHEHHKEIKDRRRLFFFILFIFLSAMFGIVFSNNLLWLYFFWEVTTLCSFLLIGYSKTEEATNNSFRALWMNLLGGLGFAAGIVYLFSTQHVIELDKLLALDKFAILIPVALISFAGLTKSAQMPFSNWLLGAMVAPTPTSALLHSSTMVKAGVYILIRMAPLLQDTTVGLMVALVGGVTFLITSCIAITQSNAKKVLAYSTIANLGLIVACAGIGSYEAVWAGVLLIVFHAIAKSLLFLSVGTVEHNIGSRDIEDMHGLIRKMPRVAIMMVIGIAGMFLAPFGMLISKWAALKAFVDYNVILVFCLAFGSAATLFFWTKWLGKLLVRGPIEPTCENHVSKTEWAPLMIFAVLTVVVCALFPLVSDIFIEPFVLDIYGISAQMSPGNEIIMAIMLGLILLLPLELLFERKDLKYTKPYLCGANIGDDRGHFYGTMGQTKPLVLSNYYMTKYFSEDKLSFAARLICIVLILVMFGGGLV